MRPFVWFTRKLSFFKNTRRTSSSSNIFNSRLIGSNTFVKCSNSSSKMEISAQTKSQGHPPTHSKYKSKHNKLPLERLHKRKIARIQISKARKSKTPLLLVVKSEKTRLEAHAITQQARHSLIDELGAIRPARLSRMALPRAVKKPAARVNKPRREKTIRATTLLINKLAVPSSEKESPSHARTNKQTKLGPRGKLVRTLPQASRKKEVIKMLPASLMDRK